MKGTNIMPLLIAAGVVYIGFLGYKWVTADKKA